MNLSAESRLTVPSSRLQLLLTHEADTLADGYMCMLSFVRNLGKLIMQVSFVYYYNPDSLPILVAMAIWAAMWTIYREGIASEISHDFEAKHSLTDFAVDCSEKYQLIVDYFKKTRMNDSFAVKNSILRETRIPSAVYDLNSEYLYIWLEAVFCAVYLVVEAPLVISGSVSLGTFLATVSVTKCMTGDFKHGYTELKGVLLT